MVINMEIVSVKMTKLTLLVFHVRDLIQVLVLKTIMYLSTEDNMVHLNGAGCVTTNICT